MAFRGETISDTLAAVLKNEPDWSQLPAATPIRVRVLLQRCLQKDPKQRLQAIGDARISLDEVLAGAPDTSLAGAAGISAPLWRRALPWAVAASLAITLTVVLGWVYQRLANVPARTADEDLMLHRSFLIVLLAICAAPLAAAQDSESGLVVHGTINVVLGNQHGMVVLTDSMLTAGDHQLHEPGQKLFQLDDHTVCTIAGFVSAPAPTPELYTRTSAIIHEYTKQLAQQPAQGIREKLTSLAYLFNFHLSAIATLRGVTGLQRPRDNYSFQLIVAGYDRDGTARIGQITLRTVQSGDFYESETQDISIVDVGKGLVSRLGGQLDIAERLLRDPDNAHDDAVLSAYAASLRKDNGQSLTIDEMKELATTLARHTAKSYPSVGGADQIAILEQGRVTKIEQQAFPEPPKVLQGFNLMVDSGFSGPNALAIGPGTTMLFVRTTFDRDRRELDGHYFFADTFKDSIVAYDGGPLYFDKSNHVVNCVLVIGPHAKRRSGTARHLADDFQWVRIVHVQDNAERNKKQEVK